VNHRYCVEAGDVSDKIDGKWQEFRYNRSLVSRDAFPCATNCSTNNESEALLENASPWTVRSNDSCVWLHVIEGYGGGQAVFRVLNSLNNETIGNRTFVPRSRGSTTCTDDPNACYRDRNVSKARAIFEQGVDHSFRIVVVPFFEGEDGGWFRLRSGPCRTRAACAEARTKCHKNVTCCEGLVCRRRRPRGPRKCRKCARTNRFCANDAHCCSGICQVRTTGNGTRTRTRRCAP
jgi:hypothetical protein